VESTPTQTCAARNVLTMGTTALRLDRVSLNVADLVAAQCVLSMA
jgi:hypothetical protein